MMEWIERFVEIVIYVFGLGLVIWMLRAAYKNHQGSKNICIATGIALLAFVFFIKRDVITEISLSGIKAAEKESVEALERIRAIEHDLKDLRHEYEAKVSELDWKSEINKNVVAATNDDREAYERLHRLAEDKTNPLQELTNEELRRIVDKYTNVLSTPGTVVPLGGLPDESLTSYSEVLDSVGPSGALYVLLVMYERAAATPMEKDSFLEEKALTSKSLLLATGAAEILMRNEGVDDMKPLEYIEILKKRERESRSN